MTPMRDISHSELLIASIGVTGEKDTTWSQVATLFREERKRSASKHETNTSQTMDESLRLAQASQMVNSNNSEKNYNLPRQ